MIPAVRYRGAQPVGVVGDARVPAPCKLFLDQTVGQGEDATQKPLKGLCDMIEYIGLNPGARKRFL